MSTDDVTSAARKVKGSVKEAIGKLTGDQKAEREGSEERAAESTDDPELQVDK